MAVKLTKEKKIQRDHIQKICLVSSSAFNAATCVWPWTAPIGAAIGLFASIDTDERKVLEDEFRHAVNVALDKTRDDLTTENSIKIINELDAMIVRPDNIDELISKCSTYRSSYCTPLDGKEIVDIFEVYFKEEVCKCPALSNQYLLTAGTLTLEKIKDINDVLTTQGKNLANIQDGVDEINVKADKINDKTDKIINALDMIFTATKTLLGECGFILISVAGCLLCGLALEINAPLFYLHTMVAYAIASLLSCSILTQKKELIFKFLLERCRKYIRNLRKSREKKSSSNTVVPPYAEEHTVSGSSQILSPFFILILIYPMISVGIYLVIVSSQLSGALNRAVLSEIECVSIGGIIYGFCKGMYIKIDEHSTK